MNLGWTWFPGNRNHRVHPLNALLQKRPVRPYRQASPSPARHRPGARSARRKGRRRHSMADRLEKETVTYVAFLDPEFPEAEFCPRADPTPSLRAPTTDGPVDPRSPRGSDVAFV